MACVDGAAVPALDDQGSPPDWLSDLPAPVLSAVLLRLGDTPEALLRLCACSRKLRDHVLQADDVWQGLCLRHGCAARVASGGAQGSGFELFCQWRSRLCRDCGVYTAYVFPLLNCRRLCETCESSPAYALITHAQALVDYPGLNSQLLATLQSKELGSGLLPAQQLKRLRACGQATLFLRSAVEALYRQKQRATRASGPGKPRGRALEETQFELDEQADGQQCEAEEDGGGTTEGDDCDAGRQWQAKLTPEEAKAARKAAKAAVKAANRVRRAGKGIEAAEPEGGRSRSWGASGASPLMDRVALGTSPGAARSSGQRGDASRVARDGATWSRSYGTSPPVGSGPRSRALVDDALGEFAISGLELSL